MEAANLITSPFGIGEGLILKLLKKGETIYTVFPSPKNVPMSFLGRINLKYGFLQFEKDVNLDKSLPRRVENVYHVYEAYSGSFTRIFKANPCATLMLLEWAKKVGVKRFIYISSGEVYGEGKNLEETSPYKPRSVYAMSKFKAEFLFLYYQKHFKIITVRIFFPFGKTLKEGFVSELHHAVKSKGKIETEYNVISPTFIDDTIEPLIKARDLDKNDVFNLCGSPIETEEFIDRLKYTCGGSAGKIKTGRIGLTGNSAKAERMLGYRKTPLNDALKNSFGK